MAGDLTNLLMQTSSTVKTKSCRFSNNEFHYSRGRLFKVSRNLKSKASNLVLDLFTWMFIYSHLFIQNYLLTCLFMVYAFSGRENVFMNQQYLPYLSCISVLML